MSNEQKIFRVELYDTNENRRYYQHVIASDENTAREQIIDMCNDLEIRIEFVWEVSLELTVEQLNMFLYYDKDWIKSVGY